MNKHLFRVIFNKARGMRMVVQETASSGGGQGSDAATRAGRVGRGFALAPMAAAMTLLLGSPAGLAQIRPDRAAPGGQRPMVLNSANGTPTINIQAPSAAGVSRNSYSQFDIGAKGAILNNSRTAVQSRIGGRIQGNGALARGSARVIVNEVNASAASQLMGALEVAGQRADVIVANPSGLVVDGLYFINAAGVSLTTGRPLYGGGGSVEGFSVQNGLIQTQGLGLDATEADYAHILARAVSLNAGVWAQDLCVVMGANEIAVDGQLRGARSGAADRPQFALDVAQLGGMYAGRIFIVSTEAGLGVRNAGALSSTRAALTLSADGQLQNTGAIAGNGTGSDLDISAQGIANSGTLTSQQDLRLADSGGITTNSGTTQAQRQLIGKFGHLGNQPMGVISAQRLEITAATLSNAGVMTQTGMQVLDISSTTLSSSGDQAVVGARAAPALPAAVGQGPAGTVPGHMPAEPMPAPSTAQEGSQIQSMPAAPLVLAAGRVEVAHHMGNTGALLANGATDLRTTRALANSGSMQLRQLHSEGLLDNSQGTLHAQQLGGTHHTIVNRAGALYVAGDLRLVAERIDNTGGTVGSAQALTARVQGRIANDGGTLSAARDLSLTARELHNNDQARIVSNTGSVQLEISQTLNNRQGQITTACADSTANIKIQAANMDSTQGAVLHNGSGQLDIRVSEALGSDQAQLLSNGSADVTAGRLSNDGGAILALQELAISARAGLSNVTGRLVASKGKLQLQAGGPVDNRGGHMLARGDLQAMVGDIDNTDGTMATTGALQLHSDAQILNARGQLQAQGAMDIRAVLLLDNRSGKLSSGADGMHLDAPTIDNRQGQIHSAQDASLRALQLDNRQGTIAQQSAGLLSIDAANALNNAGGSLVSHGGLQLAAGETFNTGGEIVSQRDVSLQVARLDSTQGLVQAGGKLDLRSVADINNHGGRILARGALNVTAAAALINTEGRLQSLGMAAVTSAALDNSAGTVSSMQAMLLDTGVFTNTGGTLAASQALELHSSALDNTAGKIGAESIAIDTRDGALINDNGKIIASQGDVSLQTGALYSDLGVVQAAQHLDIDTHGQALTNTGTLLALGHATIAAGDANNTTGTISAGQTLTLASTSLNNTAGKIGAESIAIGTRDGALINDNGKIIASQGDVSLQTGALHSDLGVVQAAQHLDIDTHGQALTNTGTLLALGHAKIDAAHVNNTTGTISAAEALTLTSTSLDNTAGKIGAKSIVINTQQGLLTNNEEGKIIASDGELNVQSGALHNGKGLMQAATTLEINTNGQLLTNMGTLLALGYATIDAAHVNNTTGTISAAEALTLTSSSLDNTFGDIGAASIAINTPKGALTNDGGNIIASKGNLNLKSAALRNEKGRLQAARDLYLDSQGQRLTNTGKLLAFGQAVINAGDVINTTGTISAAKALTLTSTSLDNTAGAIGAAAIVLDVQEGPLTNGEKGKIIASEGGLNVQGRALYNGDGRLQAAQDLTIDTHGQAFTSTGTLLSLGKATIDAGIVDNTGGTISAADALTLTSTSLDNTSGQICAASIAINTQRGTLINKASGKIIASNGELNVQSGALNNDQGLLQAAQALTVNTHGHGIANTNTGTLRGFQANIDAGPVNNAGGGIAAATTFDLKSSALDNRAGRINAASAAIDTRKGTLHNDAGHIVTSTGTLDVKSGVFHNGSGMVHAAQDLEIRTHDEALNNSGTMRAQGNARIRVGTLDNTGGHLLAGGPDTADAELTVTATGHVNNSAGHMLAGGNLTLTAPALNNSQGEIGAGGKLDARIAAAVINSGGQLVGDAEAVLNSASLQNDEQAVISSSAGPVNITTGALSNYRSSITARHATSITSQGLDNTQGTISGDSLTIDTQGQQLINADAKLLASGSSLRIDSGHLDNRRGRISAQQDAVLTAQGIHNGAGGISAPTLQVRSQDTSGNWALVDNQSGSMMADQHLQIDSGGLNNTAGAIKTTRADSRLMLDGHGADITNHQSGEDGGIVSAGALEVNAHQGMVRNSRGGIMGAAGDAEINAERIENQGGVMASHSRLQITSNANTGTGIDNSEGGLLQSLGDVKLYAGDAAIMNTRGSIRANNGVLVQSRGHVENALGNIKAGKQLSILDAHVASGAPLSSAQQTLHNRGGTLSSGKDLAIRTKEFSGASGLQSQGDMQLEIAADHTNQGDMDISGHLGITLGGNLSNQGVIRGGKGVAVSASNIDNQSGAEISSAGLMKVNARQVLTNRGVVTGGDAQINARVLDNPGEGLIVGDHLSIAADRIDNRAEGEKSGSIMARKLLEIGAAVVKNQHGASIRSDGDIRIGSSLDENRVASGASSVSNHGALIDARGSVDFFSGAVHNTNAGVKVVKDEFVGSYPAGNLVQVEGRMPESDDQYQVHPHGILIPFYSTKQRIGELGFPEGMSAGGMFKLTHPGRFLKNIPLACTPVKVENNYDDSYHLKYVYESANSMRFAEYGIEKPENYNPIEPLPGNFGATLSGKEVYWGPSSNMAGFEAALIVYEKSVQAAKNLNNVILEKIKNNNKVEGFWRDYKKIVNVRSEIFRDRVESSKPAKINAGRNITAAGEFYNVDSIVVANGVVFIPHQKNHSTKGVETTKTIGSPISYHWKSKRGGKVKQGSKKHYEVATPGQPTEQLSRITFDLPTGIYQQGHIGGATTSYAIPTKNAGKNTAFGRVEASPVVRISQGSESAAAEQGSAATKMGSLVLNGLPWADVDQHFHSPGVNVQPAQTAHPVPVEQPPQIGQSASPLRPQSASDLPIGTCGMTSVAAANIIHSGFTGTARMDVNGQELSGVTVLDVQPHSVHVAAENVVPTPATQAAGGAMPSCDVSIGCSSGQVWETGVTTLQQLRGILPDEQP